MPNRLEPQGGHQPPPPKSPTAGLTHTLRRGAFVGYKPQHFPIHLSTFALPKELNFQSKSPKYPTPQPLFITPNLMPLPTTSSYHFPTLFYAHHHHIIAQHHQHTHQHTHHLQPHVPFLTNWSNSKIPDPM